MRLATINAAPRENHKAVHGPLVAVIGSKKKAATNSVPSVSSQASSARPIEAARSLKWRKR